MPWRQPVLPPALNMGLREHSVESILENRRDWAEKQVSSVKAGAPFILQELSSCPESDEKKWNTFRWHDYKSVPIARPPQDEGCRLLWLDEGLLFGSLVLTDLDSNLYKISRDARLT